MKYIMITALTLGCLSFDAECGNIFKDIERKTRRETKRVFKQAESTGKKIGKETNRIWDQADDKVNRFGNFIENEVVPTVKQEVKNGKESFVDFVKEEVVPTMEQMGKDIGKGAEKTGKAIGNGIVNVHNELDDIVEKRVIPSVEEGIDTLSREGGRIYDQLGDKLQRAGKEAKRLQNRIKKDLSNSAEKHIKEKSPVVRTIMRIDDFVKQHPIFTYSITAVVMAGVLGASVRNFRDLFGFFSNLTSKRV